MKTFRNTPQTAAQTTGWRQRLQLWQLRAAVGGRLHAVGATVMLAAFGTDGLQDFLKGDALQVGMLIAGLVILFGAKKRDLASAGTIAGIALLGLAVMGLANDSFSIGKFLGTWLWTDEG